MEERGEPSPVAHACEPTQAAPGHVLEEDALDRILGAERQDLGMGRLTRRAMPGDDTPMPIHVRAEPGDYAEACLLPGDPLRACVAETFLEDVQQRNWERGMLGFRNLSRQARPVQSTGMGCPSAAIVIEARHAPVKRMLIGLASPTWRSAT